MDIYFTKAYMQERLQAAENQRRARAAKLGRATRVEARPKLSWVSFWQGLRPTVNRVALDSGSVGQTDCG